MTVRVTSASRRQPSTYMLQSPHVKPTGLQTVRKHTLTCAAAPSIACFGTPVQRQARLYAPTRREAGSRATHGKFALKEGLIMRSIRSGWHNALVVTPLGVSILIESLSLQH